MINKCVIYSRTCQRGMAAWNDSARPGGWARRPRSARRTTPRHRPWHSGPARGPVARGVLDSTHNLAWGRHVDVYARALLSRDRWLESQRVARLPDAPTEYSVPHNHTVVERVDVAGHTAELTQSRVGADGGLSAKAAVVNDAASPAGTWGLSWTLSRRSLLWCGGRWCNTNNATVFCELCECNVM
jgi:hypothetical protein